MENFGSTYFQLSTCSTDNGEYDVLFDLVCIDQLDSRCFRLIDAIFLKFWPEKKSLDTCYHRTKTRKLDVVQDLNHGSLLRMVSSYIEL